MRNTQHCTYFLTLKFLLVTGYNQNVKENLQIIEANK